MCGKGRQMKFLTGLFGRKTKGDADVAASSMPKAANPASAAPDTASSAAQVEQALENPGSASVNIWDLEDNAQATPDAPAPSPERAAARGRRNRTRLIGFDTSEGEVVDLFDDAPKAPTSTERVQFPVGWLLVVDGPGRGHCFALVTGMSQIGRGEDQAVPLDFGDMSISRNNHAAVVFDGASRTFTLGHGGKTNIVRLNDQPVISNESLSDGDRIKIGETTLQLKTLCGDEFDWSSNDDGEEREDVAIA